MPLLLYLKIHKLQQIIIIIKQKVRHFPDWNNQKVKGVQIKLYSFFYVRFTTILKGAF